MATVLTVLPVRIRSSGVLDPDRALAGRNEDSSLHVCRGTGAADHFGTRHAFEDAGAPGTRMFGGDGGGITKPVEAEVVAKETPESSTDTEPDES